MLLLSAGHVIQLMVDCNFAITVESGLGLYFLRPVHPLARVDFAPIGVSCKAVRKAYADGLIAAATDENDETIYLLTADGRRWVNRRAAASVGVGATAGFRYGVRRLSPAESRK